MIIPQKFFQVRGEGMAQQLSQGVLGIGDHVRLQSRAVNRHQSSQLAESESATVLEPVEGLVLSIRDIGSGQLVKQTDGTLENYVIEMVYDHTFNIRYASLRNAPRGSTESPVNMASWKRLRAALRAGAERGQFYSTATPTLLTDSPLMSLLDGWKVVKVRSNGFERLEKPEPVVEAPAE